MARAIHVSHSINQGVPCERKRLSKNPRTSPAHVESIIRWLEFERERYRFICTHTHARIEGASFDVIISISTKPNQTSEQDLVQ